MDVIAFAPSSNGSWDTVLQEAKGLDLVFLLLLCVVEHQLYAGALGGRLYIQRIADAPGAFPAELGKAQQHRVLRRLFLRWIFPRGAAGQREREQRERQKKGANQRGSGMWAHENPSRDEKIPYNSILTALEPNCKCVSARKQQKTRPKGMGALCGDDQARRMTALAMAASSASALLA